MQPKGILGAFLFSVLAAISFGQSSYFQQDISYLIEVELDDVNHVLNGKLELSYTNNSPDTLTFLYFHLWPNAYKDNHTPLAKQLKHNGEAAFHFSRKSERGYMDGIAFTSGERKLVVETIKDTSDVIRVNLDTPLLPGASVTLQTPFHVKIPLGIFSRLGHINQSYQITQWYPKPAVYDHKGWHPMPYLDQGEFYSEFGSFDVFITLPKNYIVAATGDLQTKQEQEWLEVLAERAAAKKEFTTDMSFPPSSSEKKTLHFHQERVHDFAWFADKRFNVLKGSVKLPHSDRNVTTWSFFTNENASQWVKAPEYLKDAIHYYSLWLGDYPYNQVSAVDGTISAGGGMEYPNVTVIGNTDSDFALETVIVHEVGHNWFYGILGSNERDHPWLDEGMNSFYERKYIKTKYPSATLTGKDTTIIDKLFGLEHFRQKKQYELLYLLSARKREDQRIELPAEYFSSFNYGAIVYSKTAYAFSHLESFLGESKFEEAMKLYFEKWKFRHPYPEDLREAFTSVTNQEMEWFWEGLINNNRYIDPELKSIKKTRASESVCELSVRLKQKKQEAPFPLHYITSEAKEKIQWIFFNSRDTTVKLSGTCFNLVQIDKRNDVVDINRKNNIIRTDRTFLGKPLPDPLKLRLLPTLENQYRTDVVITPLAGWNAYDGVMPGISVSNLSLPLKKANYVFTPMFGTRTGRLCGIGAFQLDLYPFQKMFRRVTLSASARRFGSNFFDSFYNRISVASRFTFQSAANAKGETSIKGRIIYVEAFPPFEAEPEKYFIPEVRLQHQSKHGLNPYSAYISTELAMGDIKHLGEVRYTIRYLNPSEAIELRLFAAVNGSEPFTANYFSYSTDYKYDLLLLARSGGRGAIDRQIRTDMGNFKRLLSNDGYEKLIAFNIKASIPASPLGIYMDAGVGFSNGSRSRQVYDAGLYATLIPNVFEIYFSSISNDPLSLRFSERISFMLNLNELNPIEKLRTLDL